jgi:hypothetical protein
MAVVGALALGFVAWRLPETIRVRRRDATRIGPLLAQSRAILAHPGFRAWAALVGCAYGAIWLRPSACGALAGVGDQNLLEHDARLAGRCRQCASVQARLATMRVIR